MSKKNIAFALLSAIVSLSALAFALHALDTHALANAIRHLSPWVLGLACLLTTASQYVSALRMRALLARRHARSSVGESVRLYFAASFANLFLPGGVGGDGLKCLFFKRRYKTPLKRSAQIALSERANGLWALCLAAQLGATTGTLGAVWAPMGPLAAVALTLCYRLGSKHLCGEHPEGERAALPYSIAAQMLQLAAYLCLTYGFDDGSAALPNLPDLAALFFCSSAMSILPFSIGGAGLRETTLLYGCALLHAHSVAPIIAGTAFFLSQAIASLPGAFFLSMFAPKKT